MKYLKLFNESIIEGDFLFKKIEGGSESKIFKDWVETHKSLEININDLSMLKDKFEHILLKNSIYWKKGLDKLRRYDKLNNITDYYGGQRSDSSKSNAKVLSISTSNIEDITFLKYDDEWWVVDLISYGYDVDGDDDVFECFYICDGIEGLDALIYHLKDNPLK